MIKEVTMSSGVELRRHSVGISSSGNNEKKVVPHYLRASTGSCHDFCKYGRKHVQEAKEILSMTKRAARKPFRRRSEGSIDGIMTSVAKVKASVDSDPTKVLAREHRKSFDSEFQIFYTSDPSKQELATKSSGSQKQIGNGVQVNKNIASLLRVKPSFVPKSHVSSSSKTWGQGISSSFGVEIPSQPTSKRVQTSPISSSPLRSSSEMMKTHPNSTFQMVKTSSKSASMMVFKVSSFEDKEMELSEKPVTSLNPDSVTMETIYSMNSSEGFGGQKNSEIKMKKRESSSKVALPLTALLSSKPSCKGIANTNARKHKGPKIESHNKNQPKPTEVEPEEHNNEAQEKTLYIIKMETANQTLQSDQNESQESEMSSNLVSSRKFLSSSSTQSSSQEAQEDQEESEYATSEFEEDSSAGNPEIEYMENVETLDIEENGKPQEDKIVCSEDKDCQKLRANMADTQIEKNSPRRLKFLRGSVLGDNASDANNDADNIGAITGPEKLVLRHQDVQAKKDEHGLYNNVIKETASKLIEIEKGKVKALVSAFETVISLQEKKISANIIH
ncbi:uncharacterized protein LOC113862542 [Abrus precatorius]|uniref:Uncharacterized protein LOC113862542 n=1 Tax=Abrus precatorius TaxID=3816 RepID=A0A8B8L9L0_ABRPR|nr:uncharacterized protein LOC113862542 [Abrus precatorius]